MQCSLLMLRDVIAGQSLSAIGERLGITRTAVEQRVKQMAQRLIVDVGIDGMSARTAVYIERLRQHRPAVEQAIAHFEPLIRPRVFAAATLSDDDIQLALARIRMQSTTPARDQALFLVLLSTGLRPLELARLRVSDYLDEQGDVRHESEVRSEVAVNQLARPLYFRCVATTTAVDGYLQDRRQQGFYCLAAAAYRGLDPASSLFLSKRGRPFAIRMVCTEGHQQFHCRQLLDQLRKLFGYIHFPGLSALSLRQTLAARLYERGATDEQVGELFGILDVSHVRECFPRQRKPLSDLVTDLV